LRQSFDAFSSENMAAAVTRDLDLVKLLAHWDRVCDSNVQVIMLKDPAGTGWTRLLQTFQLRCSTQPHSWLETACLPSYQNSPLRPILDTIERKLCLQPGEPLPVRFAKLLSTLGQYELLSTEAAPYLFALLSLPLNERSDLLNGYSSAQMEL